MVLRLFWSQPYLLFFFPTRPCGDGGAAHGLHPHRAGRRLSYTVACAATCAPVPSCALISPGPACSQRLQHLSSTHGVPTSSSPPKAISPKQSSLQRTRRTPYSHFRPASPLDSRQRTRFLSRHASTRAPTHLCTPSILMSLISANACMCLARACPLFLVAVGHAHSSPPQRARRRYRTAAARFPAQTMLPQIQVSGCSSVFSGG